MVRVYAHRGASIERPETTLAAFDRALALGAWGIELDVHLSSDGVPVVIHDETVDRTTTGIGRVADLTGAEMASLDAGDGEHVPSFTEVLDLIGDRAHIDVEVKATAAADAVLAEIQSRPSLRWAMSSFDHDVLRSVRSISSTAELWPLAPAANEEAMQSLRDLGSSQLAIWDRGIDSDIVAFLAEHGVSAWVWTVNDPDRAAILAGWGVAGICTDDPAAILATLDRTRVDAS